MKILYYPFKWNSSFLNKDVCRFPKEYFGEFLIIKNLFNFIYRIFNVSEVIIFHISFKNLPIVFLCNCLKIKVIVKSDLNSKRTKSILYANGIRLYLYKYILTKTEKIIIETNNELILLRRVLRKKGIKSNLIFKHNKVFTTKEFDYIENMLKTTPKKNNQVIYYLRYNSNDDDYNYNCGLDIFLKSLHFNTAFYHQKKIIIYGSCESWLKEFIFDKFGEYFDIEFLGVLDRMKIIDLYIESQYFILTSRKESFSLSLIEAMICDCKIITTYSGVSRDFNLSYLSENQLIYKINDPVINKLNYVYNFYNI